MKGEDRKVGQTLHASNAFAIPPYQRGYEWEPARWQGVVSDVLQAATATPTTHPHWLGIILRTDDTDVRFPGDRSVQHYTVIDGQQRLVTLLVWLAALVHHANDVGQTVALDITKVASISVQESDRKPFDVAMRNQWRDPINAQLLQAPQTPLAAYVYFRWVLWLGEDALLEEEPVRMPRIKPVAPGATLEGQWGTYVGTTRGKNLPRGGSINADDLIAATQERLMIYNLVHQPLIDEGQPVVFDTLNGMRTELQPLDHVRNSLFIRIPHAEATALYKNQWEPYETALRAVPTKRMSPAKLFLYDYLIAMGEKKRQKTLNANRGAGVFAQVANSTPKPLTQFVREDVIPAMAVWPIVVRHTDSLVLDGVPKRFSQRVRDLMTSIHELSANPANPVVLHYATAYVRGLIPEKDLESALFATESFLVRQLLAAKPLSPLRSKIMDVMGLVDRDPTPAKLTTALLAGDWVEDTEIIKGAKSRVFYGQISPRQLGAIFRGVERHLSGPGAMTFALGTGADQYTIEHIYPQHPQKWKGDVHLWGADTTKMHRLLHTLGNLTVASNRHNRQVGNNRLIAKQDYPDVPGNAAPLSLNKDWLRARKWTELSIEARTNKLLTDALDYWRRGP